jgi:hypothetical protein
MTEQEILKEIEELEKSIYPKEKNEFQEVKNDCLKKEIEKLRSMLSIIKIKDIMDRYYKDEYYSAEKAVEEIGCIVFEGET